MVKEGSKVISGYTIKLGGFPSGANQGKNVASLALAQGVAGVQELLSSRAGNTLSDPNSEQPGELAVAEEPP